MSEERTLPATPRRLRQARDQGKTAKTQEFGPTARLLLLSPLLAALPELAVWMKHWFVTCATQVPAAALLILTQQLLVHGLTWLLAAGLLGLALGFLQTRAQISLGQLLPSLDRLSPAKGLGRLFSLKRLARPGLGVLALLLLILIQTQRLAQIFGKLLHGSDHSAGVLLEVLPRLVSDFLLPGVALLLLLAATDYGLQRASLRRSLRMNLRDLKEEHRNAEGDPSNKQARASRQREIAKEPPPPLQEARCLLLNPTRLAIALHYDDDHPVPIGGTRASGRAARALRIKARRLGLPLLRHRTLARALYRLEPNVPIPPELFDAVAALLASLPTLAPTSNNEGTV